MVAERYGELPKWTSRLLAEFDASDRRASAVAGGLTPEQLNWKRAETEWSVGQCLDHLVLSNEVYLPVIERALAGRPDHVVQEITPGWFGRWFLTHVIEPSPTSARRRAPRKIAPVFTVDRSVLERFHRTNGDARAVVRRASRLDVNRIRFTNPFVPVIRFTAGTGFVILATHQRRHLIQAEGIRTAVRFPA